MSVNRTVVGVGMGACLCMAACGTGPAGTKGSRPEVAVTFPDVGLGSGAEDSTGMGETTTGPEPDGALRHDARPAGDDGGDLQGEDATREDLPADSGDIARMDAGDANGQDLADDAKDWGALDAGCHTGGDCPEGFWCDEPTCRACETAHHCGLDCVECGPGLDCWQGKCVECVAGADCGPGRWCDGGTCVLCADDDPAHCGADCEPCLGEWPACVAGKCACTEDSCGNGRRCVDGDCRACDTAEACGPKCVPCGVPVPYCESASVGCVECLDTGHCGQDETCLGGACVSVCAKVQGCSTDEGPDGRKCSTAKVVGRSAALAGYVHNGDTTNDGNNDDLSFPLFQDKVECWDANEDNFFRIYLLAGERLDLTLTPKDALFDSMLKVYRGTGCKAGGDAYDCINTGGDGKPDSIKGWTAPADGWVTIVVDGRRAFDEDGDWGPYTLEVRLTCLRPDCCCPASG